MLHLTKKSATLALSTGLVLTAAACGNNDPSVGLDPDVVQDAEPVAEIEDLTGVATAVEVDESFLGGLQSLGVTPGVVGDATLEGSRLSFPITGGEVTYYDPDSDVEPFVQGEILHEGSGLSLTANGTTVELTDFVVDPGESVLTGKVSANGDVVQEDAPLFFLDGSTLEPLEVDESEGTAVLEGTTVSLTQEAADLLNETFGTDALTEFFLVGTAEITLALEGSQATATPVPTTVVSPTAIPTVIPTGEPTTGSTEQTPTPAVTVSPAS